MTGSDEQRRDEIRALGGLALREIAGAAAGVSEIHAAVADRVFAGLRLGLGDLASPVQTVHDAIADGTCAVITEACDTAAGIVGAMNADGRGRPPSQTRAGAMAIAAVNGLIGDALDDEKSALAEGMTIRVDGVAVSPTTAALTAAFPAAGRRIVVFVHGLMETEAAWIRAGAPSYGARLAADLGAAEVQIRYNTGRHISQNGRDLERLMADVVENWPTPLDEIAFVGHSMGGLVVRSACFRAASDDRSWVRSVRHMVSLGTPHLGAPMARAVHHLAAALDVVGETRPVARLLRRRSSGVRDLFHGSLVDEDWADRDTDALTVAAVRAVPLLEGATHIFVSATITRDARHPLGRMIGDGLVLTPSATGRNRHRRIGFRDEDGIAIGSAHHFTLLDHPEVYDAMLARLRRSPDAAVGQRPISS